METKLKNYLNNLLPEIVKLRQAMHSHPELGFQEQKTAKLIVEFLQQHGYTDIKTNVAKTGVVALLDSGRPGKTLALRADIDALPICEKNSFQYQSKNKDVMHACGHDGHSAVLLYVAALLSKIKDQLCGKIKFIFQPAEELAVSGGGAKAMIEEGVLDNPKVDAIFGWHNWPESPVGHVSVKSGCLLTGMDTFDITIKGKSGHAATLKKCIDPILLSAQFIQHFQSIIPYTVSPDEIATMAITKIEGGNSYNVIPESVVMSGAVRTTSQVSRETIKNALKSYVKNSAKLSGAVGEVLFLKGAPPTINTEFESQFVYNVAQHLRGKENVTWLQHSLIPTEDFSYFLEKVKGCYFLIGNGESSEPLHTDKYDFNDKVIPHVANILINLVLLYSKALEKNDIVDLKKEVKNLI